MFLLLLNLLFTQPTPESFVILSQNDILQKQSSTGGISGKVLFPQVLNTLSVALNISICGYLLSERKDKINYVFLSFLNSHFSTFTFPLETLYLKLSSFSERSFKSFKIGRKKKKQSLKRKCTFLYRKRYIVINCYKITVYPTRVCCCKQEKINGDEMR